MRRNALWVVCLVALSSACGGVADGSSTEDARAPSREDSGRDAATSRSDAPVADAKPIEKDAGEPAQDSAPADAAAAPVGTLLDVAKYHVVFGVTSDNYVIYETINELGRTEIYALSLAAGSTPIALAGGGDAGTAGAGAAGASVFGPLVFIQTQTNDNYVGPLFVWSSTMASPRLLTDASIGSAFPNVAVSKDFAHFVYTGDSNTTGSVATLYGGATAAGATPTVLAASIEPTEACNFYLGLSGTYFIANYCAVSDAGTASPAALYSFDESTWSSTPVASGELAFWQDNTGTDVAVVTAGNALELAPVALGAAPTQIDTGVSYTYLSTTDTFIAYITTAGALKTATLPFTGTTTTLEATNADSFEIVSPDEKWIVTFHQTDPATGYPTDLSLASTAVASSSTVLTSGGLCATASDGFTKDSSHIVFYSDIQISGGSFAGGSLNAAPVGTAGPVATITTSKALLWTMLGGARMLYQDNYDPTEGVAGHVTLHLVDLSTSTPAITIQAGADILMALSADGTKLVYSIDTSSIANSLYVYDIPQ